MSGQFEDYHRSSPLIFNNGSEAEIEEIVKICMVCETMGYKAEFVYVHTLKLAQKGNLQEKHTGYLAATFFLHPHHELVILLINTLQRDLSSSNHLEVVQALTVVSQLISNETVHNVLHLVEERLQHPVASVRKSAVLTFAHCLQLIGSESSYHIALPKLERCLSDPELEIVSVVIPVIHRIIKDLPGEFSYLVDSLLQLLEQILMRRIPHSLVYSDIPAPWLQVEILKLLKHLCKTPETSAKLAPILKKILVQTGLYHTIAQAIVFQVIEAVTSMEVDTELLEVSMSSVSLLLKSRDVNMKYMGLDALVLLLKKMEPNITPSQQEVILDCLKLPDETLQLKTLELMYHLANPSNVQALCKKMIEFLDRIKQSQKKNLALKILQLAEQYHDRHQWYVSVVSAVLLQVNDLLDSSDVCKIINIITKDNDLRKIAKEVFTELVKEKKSLPSSVIKIYSSVLSEPSEFTFALSELSLANEEEALSWLLVSLMESTLKHKSITPECVDALKRLQEQSDSSMNIFVQQILQISDNLTCIKEYDSDLKVDPTLTCLDEYVLNSLLQTSECYEPPSYRNAFPLDDAIIPSSNTGSDSFPAMSGDETNLSQNCESSLQSPTYSIFSSPSISFHSLSSNTSSFSPQKTKAVWTKEGRSKATTEQSSQEDQIKPEVKESDEFMALFAGVQLSSKK